MDWLAFAAPMTALALAMATRSAATALFGALWVSESLMSGLNPAMGLLFSIDRVASAVSGNAEVLLYCLSVGALIGLMDRSGGLSALVRGLMNAGVANGPRGASLTAVLSGVAIFIETNASLLTSGLIARPLFDRFGLSRARLAYLIDSTSAPVSVLILLNGWGAFALSLMADLQLDQPTAILAATVPLNFYALFAVAAAVWVAVSGRPFGRETSGPEMRAAASRPGDDASDGPEGRLIFALAPLAVMIGGAFAFLAWTGDGDLLAGDGARSILWAVALAAATAGALTVLAKRFNGREVAAVAGQGVAAMGPSVLVILLALALSGSLRELGLGAFIAQLAAGPAPSFALPALIFLATGLMSLTTGTSWGSYGIMIPLAMPLALAAGVSPSLALAAILGGGVFGDHCSPISDTTVIAALAADCDALEHVRTQAPYAAGAGLLALLAYLIAGALTV
ncbi:MAG: Na+/H+ antiporter NhaC family protein [Pseudomonadota bacterium]